MYKIKTPNPNYNGTTAQVRFLNGIGETTDEQVKNELVNDYGYLLVEENKNLVEKPNTDENNNTKKVNQPVKKEKGE